MNNVKAIEGIELTIKGLELIKESLEIEETGCCVAASDEVSPIYYTKFGGEVGYTREELEGMKYNEFKKLAASLGVKCTGTREEILARILDLNSTDNEKNDIDDSLAGDGEVEETEIVEEDTGEIEDEFEIMAKEIAEETDVADIIEALADVSIKATKKNYFEKLVEALKKGLLDVEEEDVEDENGDVVEADDSLAGDGEVEETEITTDSSEEINANSYFEQYDQQGYNNPEDMTEERAEAVVKAMDKLLVEYSEGEITDEDIQKFIEDNSTDDEIDLLGDDYSDDDLFMYYMELKKRFIDNEGDEHVNEEPYELGDEDFCCGHKLKYSKSTKKYICEICGSEYEVEE